MGGLIWSNHCIYKSIDVIFFWRFETFERILTDELSSKKRRVSREPVNGATPTRDENETRQRLGSIENGTRARMSSSDANETINIKSKWGDDSESEEEQPPPKTHFQGMVVSNPKSILL